TVPGTVHTDLLAEGKIPDPFYRMNELDVQWVDAEQWIYRKEFTISREFVSHDAVDLVAEGLDTFARIKLNGKVLGESANMFVEHRFDVKRAIRAGNNVLEISFDSPTIRTKQLESRYGALKVSHEPHRTYARKAQYSFGWDWGPKLITSGIWRPVYLETYSGNRIESIFVRTAKITRKRADIRVDVALKRRSRVPVDLTITISGGECEYYKSLRVAGNKKSVTVAIPNPRLWWPNGYGEQHLYKVRVAAASNGIEGDTKSAFFGIRTVQLLQEKDADGRSFIFQINGVKIYCKGVNWIPSDSFIPRIPASTYERLLTLSRDAHMNMVRVWGGGIYEQETFYELCDRLGLMVWQDFMFACGEYPEESWFLRQVKDEAEKAVLRLRNHPSIVLWCGNNECEWIFCRENPGKKPDEMNGAVIFRDILPSVCRTLDGTRPYWRSSPFGTGFPNEESNGNHHEWDVWGFWKDYRQYEEVRARFVTEFGFQAPASMKTMEAVMLPADRHPQSRVFEHHNKLPEGTERLYRFQAAHYEVGSDIEDFVFKGQLVQAEALKMAVEHWRRRKFKTAGSLIWQLNDCWPVSSWSLIDSALRPKAAYYYAKRFFEPVLVSFRRTTDSVEVWVTNDSLSSLRGDLRVVHSTFDGMEAWTKLKSILAPGNTSHLFMRIPKARFAEVDRSQSYLRASLQVGTQVFDNRHFFSEPKHMQARSTEIGLDLSNRGDNVYEVTVTSKTLARHVRVDTEGSDVEIEDNYFDVDPGTMKKTTIIADIPLDELRRKLKIRSLWD
ncbi:MAG: glycoside hydrolase family 2 protein, partial [Bacteroidota bacterium]